MTIYIGADHRGFELKEELKKYIGGLGYTIVDLGNSGYDENDDYPTFASAVAEKVSSDLIGSKGIVICGSGVGVDIVANKFRGIRSGLCFSPDQTAACTADDHINILSLPASSLDNISAKKIVSVWLQTPVSTNPKHVRRLDQIRDLEQKIKDQ